MLCDKAAWTLISEVEESEVRGLAPDSQVRLRSLSYYAFVFFFFCFFTCIFIGSSYTEPN